MRNPVGLKFYIQLEATIVLACDLLGYLPTIPDNAEPREEDHPPEFARSC